MMHVVKSEGATAVNGSLRLVSSALANSGSNPGVLIDVHHAEYAIFDAEGDQLYPETPGEFAELDLVTNKKSTGVYCAEWDSSEADIGAYSIVWKVVQVEGGEERVFEQDFDVVPFRYYSPAYCSLSSLREAGIIESEKSNKAAQRLIMKASRAVEMYTGRTFSSKPQIISIDGTGGRALLFNDPIVAVGDVSVSLVSDFSTGNSQILPDTYRIYNRHLSSGLLDPDDRENPRLEFVHGDDLVGVHYVESAGIYRLTQMLWPVGQQNCIVSGFFGYTEPDGSWEGCTPDLIQEATRLLCFKYRYSSGSEDREDSVNRGRILSEHTRDQGYMLNHPTSFAGYTGDAEIDGILAKFTRPPKLGAA